MRNGPNKQIKMAPAAPLPYRPQPVPKCLQLKVHTRAQSPRISNAIQRAEATTPSTSTTSASQSEEEFVYVEPNYKQMALEKELAKQKGKETASRKVAIPLAANETKALKLAHKSKTAAIGKILESTMRSSASNVEAVIRVKIRGGQEIFQQTLTTSNLVSKDPYKSGPPHHHDVNDWTKLTLSKDDAEAKLFPAIEEVTFKFMEEPKTKGKDSGKEAPQPEIHHMVTLVGPHGPCDGCQIRMQLFRESWLKQARQSPARLRLTLTYISALARHNNTGTRDPAKIKHEWKGEGQVPGEAKFHYGITSEQPVTYNDGKKNHTLNYYRITASNR
jgi:hypothetical protein